MTWPLLVSCTSTWSASNSALECCRVSSRGETTVARGNEVAYRLADGVGSRELHKAEYANVVAAAVLSRDDGRPRYPSSLVGKDVELNPTSGFCLTENTEATR